jgi:ribosome-binding ATPase YchF (GTP1/OBG family)
LDKLSLVEELLNRLTNLQLARSLVLDPTLDKELIKWRKSLNLLTDKPILRLANVNYGGKNHNYSADVYMDVKLELELQDASMEERQALDLPVEKPMDLLIRKCYQTLNLGTFLTTGRTETRAWTFPLGWLAPRCAGIIHSDFEKTFINAEVISYHDLLVAGGWKEAAEAGKLRIEGKNYLMQDGDVVEFRVGAQAK